MNKKYVSLSNLTNYDKKIKEYIKSLLGQIIGATYPIDSIYPVGSIYISTNNTAPSTLFGGEWEQIKDTFLLSAGDNYSAGNTGGESEHILTVNEMPSHTHQMKTDLDVDEYNVTWAAWTESVGGWSQYPFAQTAAPTHVTKTGGDKPHNNMPPYLTVYMWKRIG